MPDVEINWYEDEVMLAVQDAVNLDKVAFRIEERAKINVTENDQVDTGFMLNAIYTVTREASSYGEARARAGAKNPKARMSPQAALIRGAQAAVAAGAEYSIYQEIKHSFLLRAAQEMAREVGGLVRKL